MRKNCRICSTYINSKRRTNKKERKHRKITKTDFPREQVEKADRD